MGARIRRGKLILGRQRVRPETPKEAVMIRKTLLGALVALTLAGCNTVDGIGRDISGIAVGIGNWF
jgi:predicted small secreted protein